MATAIASVPVLKGEASGRFELQMQESERKRGSVDFANDSMKKIPGARKKKVEGAIPREKHHASCLAVMIGRLGVSQFMQGKNLGTEVLGFIKAWLVDPMDKTGCRFVLVDSYNQDKNFRFHERNGFKFLFSSEEQERDFRDLKPDKPLNTRPMYFDLIELPDI